MAYELYQYADGDWYLWGTYFSVERLAEAINGLVALGSKVQVKAIEVDTGENRMDKR